MAKYDSKIDIEKLLTLKFEIDDELSHVKDTLLKVNEACATRAGETDDIMKTIEKTSIALRGEWDKLTNAFVQVGEKVQDVIEGYKKYLEDKTAEGNGLKKNL